MQSLGFGRPAANQALLQARHSQGQQATSGQEVWSGDSPCQLIDDFRSDWRQRVSGADLATSLEPLHAHNREILRLMAALTLGEGGETRLSKVLRD